MIRFALPLLTGAILAVSIAGAAPPVSSIPPPPDGNKFPLPAPDTLANGDVRGQLAIRAVQGTPGGPPVGSADVTVQLLHQGTVILTRQDQLDEYGVVVIEDLPIEMGVLPVVRVAHAGVSYQQSGAIMTAEAPEQMIEVVCYEVSPDAPSWSVQMRHVMITNTDDGLAVNEVIVVENPVDRTWTGTPGPDGRGRTTSFILTPGAHDVKLGRGFHDWCCTSFTDGELINHLPLMPQRTELMFQYAVSPKNGAYTIDLFAPTSIGHLMVIVPEEITPTGVVGLEPAGSSTIGEKNVRFYAATDVRPDALVGIVLSRRAGAVAGGPAAPDDGTSVSIAKVIAAIGGGILVLLAVVIMLSRPSRPAASV